MNRRRAMLAAAAAVVLGAAYFGFRKLVEFPPDTTPEGAYLRIAYNVSEGRPRAVFDYLEDAAQHACFTLRDYRLKASERIAATYPEPERSRLLEAYRPHASAADASAVWLEIAERRGFVVRLRRDLSGIAKVEVAGDRATIETARGTRYAFRRREGGIWGLAIFTAELVAEAERAARDWQVVEAASLDYERAR